MRALSSAVIVSSLILHSLGNAQGSQPLKRGDRLFVSAGLGSSGWNHEFDGLRLGAEYHFTPVERVLGFRAHLGTFWTPTQAYSRRTAFYEPGFTFEGFGQVVQLDLGVTASLTPWPRGRVSPYGLLGLAAVQQWTSGWGYYREANGNVSSTQRAPTSMSSGAFGLVIGGGLRVRAGGRLWQFEVRRLPSATQTTYSFGTAIHF